MTEPISQSVGRGQWAAFPGIIGVLLAAAQAGAQEIYLADHYERPGFIYHYDPAVGGEEAVYTHPDGNLSAIAFRDDYVYYVNANAEHI